MKISEVDKMLRFDLGKQPIKVSWILSFPETFSVKSKIKKVRMKGLKEAYILLCNHNSFFRL